MSTPESRDDIDAAVALHDESVARALDGRCVLWMGAEPTFTRADSLDSPWLVAAEGGDKRERARALLDALQRRWPGSAAVHAVGRTYDGEAEPRFCFGLRAPRDGGSDAARLAPWTESPCTVDVDLSTSHWLTVTPDPAVVEVNMSPTASLADFAWQVRAVYAAADEAGLSPARFAFNGEESDSGGGGQLTFGGPAPEASPFLVLPALLPSLVRYLNHHPALSYLFAGDCLGSAAQGPRPDEGNRERFDELAFLLDHGQLPTTPEQLWTTFAPLLVDTSGNSHRAEVNVEKLYNPHLKGRGRLGLVELRSLRMPSSPSGQIAVAALFRAIVARLVVDPFREPLRYWEGELHDRYALPAVLEADLEAVLDDLVAHDLGLAAPLEACLWGWHPPLAELRSGDATLTLTPAREFWPLVGDVASQERRSARLVDSSIRRLELRVRSGSSGPLDPGTLTVEGWPVPLRGLDAADYVAGVRFRAFVPNPGFHPGMPANDPLTIRWTREETVTVRVHQWKPEGGVYDGLPLNARDAASRRRDRVVVIRTPGAAVPKPLTKDRRFTVDVRCRRREEAS